MGLSSNNDFLFATVNREQLDFNTKKIVGKFTIHWRIMTKLTICNTTMDM